MKNSACLVLYSLFCGMAWFQFTTMPIEATPASTTPIVARDSTSKPPEIPFEKGVLSNGIQYIFHIDRSLPLIHVNQTFHVGQRDDGQRFPGMVHLIEHLLFERSENRRDNYFPNLDRIGGSDYRGQTFLDKTVFRVTIPSGRLPYLLWLESNRLSNFLKNLSKEKLDIQRNIIINEFQQKRSGNSTRRQWDLLRLLMFPPAHPYSQPFSEVEGLRTLQLNDVEVFFKKYFIPRHLSIAIAGDFDPSEAKRLIEKYFDDFPSAPSLNVSTRTWNVQNGGEKIFEIPRMHAFRANSCFFYPIPSRLSSQFNYLHLASIILNGGDSSRFRQRERRENGQIRFFCEIDEAELCSEILFGVEVPSDRSLSEGEKILSEEIAKLSQELPTVGEVERAKALWEKDFIFSLEKLSGKAQILNNFNTITNNPGAWKEDYELYQQASPKDIQEAAKNFLISQNRMCVRSDIESEIKENVKVSMRPQPPSLTSLKPFSLPKIEKTSLDNGLQIQLVEKKGLPLVSVSLQIGVGSAFDPPDKEGCAYLSTLSFLQGGQLSDEETLLIKIANLGSSLDAFVRPEASIISFECLTKNLEKIFPLFAEIVCHPTISPIAFENLKNRQMNQPENLESHIFQGALYNFKPPLGRPVGGWRNTVASLSIEDIANFHKNYWTPQNAALIFSGEVSLQEATKIAAEYFGSWKGASLEIASLPPVTFPESQVFLIDQPDAKQTKIFQIFWLPVPGDSDILPFRFWLRAFEKRLFQRLREENGWAYSVTHSINLFSPGGFGYIKAIIQNDKSKEALKIMLEELKKIHQENPVTESELVAGRGVFLQGLPRNLDSVDKIASQVGFLLMAGLSMPTLEEISRISILNVQEVGKQYALPKRAIYIFVGNKNIIEQCANELKFENFQWLDSKKIGEAL